MTWLTRSVLHTLSPAGARAPLTVLIFHRVLQDPDPLQPHEPSVHDFDARMAWVARHFNVLPLLEAIQRLRDDSLPARALAITFDDGYADNYTLAMPVLRRHGLHATFFVTTGFLNGGRMFNDSVLEIVRRAADPMLDVSHLGFGQHAIGNQDERWRALHALLNQIKYLPVETRNQAVVKIAEAAAVPMNDLPVDLMMSNAQVAALHASGMEIGCHTITHPMLTRIELAAARAEIEQSRATLTSLTGAPIKLFAYPNGRPKRDYDSSHVELIRELGFTAAVSTARGVARQNADPFQIPRFTPWDRAPWRFGARLAQTLLQRGYVKS